MANTKLRFGSSWVTSEGSLTKSVQIYPRNFKNEKLLHRFSAELANFSKSHNGPTFTFEAATEGDLNFPRVSLVRTCVAILLFFGVVKFWCGMSGGRRVTASKSAITLEVIIGKFPKKVLALSLRPGLNIKWDVFPGWARKWIIPGNAAKILNGLPSAGGKWGWYGN